MMLEDHEVFCPKCKGTGKGETWKSGEFEFTPECNHCLGEGKLDWLERIIGKKLPPYYFQSFYAYEDIIEEASNEIKNEIDKEIIDELLKESNKIKKED